MNKNPSNKISRRSLLTSGGAALAGLGALPFIGAGVAQAMPLQADDEVIPWLDQMAENPVPQVIGNQLVWEKADTWITPNDKFFSIAHYGNPAISAAAAANWKLDVTGQVYNPLSLSLAQIKNRYRQDVTFTLECSGNHGLPFFHGGIGNARWSGVPLASILYEAGLKDSALEVVFWGADEGEEKVRDIPMKVNFARAMSVKEALDANILIGYAMNGADLPAANGYPLRLVAPGWYGIASVKWLKRIEVRPQRFQNRFMARDYVTIRKEERNGETIWTENLVGKALLKSAPVRVVRNNGKLRIHGAAWGGPIYRMEFKVDNGDWQFARYDQGQTGAYAWSFWSLDWPNASPGEHTISTRAVDWYQNTQPAPTDPSIANKQTYWESNGQITRKVRI